MNLILCGYQGCGKTSVAKAFSDRYGFDCVDTDELIAQRNNKKTTDKIYYEVGAEQFRAIESQTIQSLSPKKNTIIATGGGVVLDPQNVSYLKSLGKIIYLYARKDVIFERLSSAHFKKNFTEYFYSREQLYEQVSDFILDVSDLTIEQIVTVLGSKYVQ